MTQEEAQEAVAWLKDQLTVEVTPWQERLFVYMLTHPDAEFSLPVRRK